MKKAVDDYDNIIIEELESRRSGDPDVISEICNIETQLKREKTMTSALLSSLSMKEKDIEHYKSANKTLQEDLEEFSSFCVKVINKEETLESLKTLLKENGFLEES